MTRSEQPPSVTDPHSSPEAEAAPRRHDPFTAEEKAALQAEYAQVSRDIRQVYGPDAHSVVVVHQMAHRLSAVTLTFTVYSRQGLNLPPLRARPDPYEVMERTAALLGDGHWTLGERQADEEVRPPPARRSAPPAGSDATSAPTEHRNTRDRAGTFGRLKKPEK